MATKQRLTHFSIPNKRLRRSWAIYLFKKRDKHISSDLLRNSS